MMRPGRSRLLAKELMDILGRRLAIAFALSCILAIGSNVTWSLYQHNSIDVQTSDSLAASLSESIRTNDLISIKRVLQAFQLANPGARICLRTEGDIEFTAARCPDSKFKEYLAPLTARPFLVAVHSPIDHRPIVLGGLFLLLSSSSLLYAQSAARNLTKKLLDDLYFLTSPDLSESCHFAELSDARKKIENARRLEEENHRINLENKAQQTAILLGAQVAHDMRSPLTALKMFAHAHANLPDEHKEIFHSALDRLSKIASDLLKQSRRVLHKDFSILSDLSPLSTIVSEIFAEKRMEYANLSGITLVNTFSIEKDRLLTLEESSDIKRSISNLINNAVEASSNGGRVDLVTRNIAGEIEISVQDNGVGIPAHLLPHLTQLGVTSGKTDGSGLGLYSAKEAVTAMGGTITIDSVPGKGTNVRLRIPLVGRRPLRERSIS